MKVFMCLSVVTRVHALGAHIFVSLRRLITCAVIQEVKQTGSWLSSEYFKVNVMLSLYYYRYLAYNCCLGYFTCQLLRRMKWEKTAIPEVSWATERNISVASTVYLKRLMTEVAYICLTPTRAVYTVFRSKVMAVFFDVIPSPTFQHCSTLNNHRENWIRNRSFAPPPLPGM